MRLLFLFYLLLRLIIFEFSMHMSLFIIEIRDIFVSHHDLSYLSGCTIFLPYKHF
jgi:hypothetical protein